MLEDGLRRYDDNVRASKKLKSKSLLVLQLSPIVKFLILGGTY